MANSELSYQNRPLTVSLANNKQYIVTSLKGEESISGLSQFSLEVATNQEIEEKNLGKPVTVSFNQFDEKSLFTGLCISIEFTGFSEEKQIYHYLITLADPMSVLSYRRSRQVFQNMTTKQILESLLGASDFKKYFTFSVSGNGKKHEYCVQLDETDQAFIQRLLANEGWHYHARHSSGKPSIIVADSNQRFNLIPEPTIFFQSGAKKAFRTINNWQKSSRIGTAKISLADHTQVLSEMFDSGERKSAFSHSQANLEQSYFALGYDNKNEVRDAAKKQMEALDVERSGAKANSTIAAIACGHRFNLKSHPVNSMNQEYLVTQISHEITCDESGMNVVHQNQFTCIPTSTIFRPKMLSKPKVHSVHSATVTAPKGKEIYRDKSGRIKVQFHWDTLGKNDENSSCWLPVSQGMASKGFGAHFTPRAGDEVLVQYIDGDPDRPVVTGSLYTKSNTQPFASDTQSGFKTHSTPKGGSKQGNELRFDDQKDKEELYLHAEKDMLVNVNNNSQSTIKGLKKTDVEKSITLNTKEQLNINSEKETISKSKGEWKAESSKDLSLKSGGEWKAESSKDSSIKSGSNLDLSAKSSITIDGRKISLSGKSKIELKVGASKIEISASGIKVDAPQVSISGKGKAEMKAAIVNIDASGKADLKGALVSVAGKAMTQIKAGAMVQIQGGITKVN